MKKLTVEEMYRICNKYQFFTNGDNSQYDKLFDVVREDSEDLPKIVTILWICSEQSYKEIYNTLIKELK